MLLGQQLNYFWIISDNNNFEILFWLLKIIVVRDKFLNKGGF
jgi:hypothetical protein